MANLFELPARCCNDRTFEMIPQRERLAVILRRYFGIDGCAMRLRRAPVPKHEPPCTRPRIEAHGERIRHHFRSRKNARSRNVPHAQSQQTIRDRGAVEKPPRLIRSAPAPTATSVHCTILHIRVSSSNRFKQNTAAIPEHYTRSRLISSVLWNEIHHILHKVTLRRNRRKVLQRVRALSRARSTRTCLIDAIWIITRYFLIRPRTRGVIYVKCSILRTISHTQTEPESKPIKQETHAAPVQSFKNLNCQICNPTYINGRD